MPFFLFLFFAAVSVLGAVGVILNRNPVSCAISMIVSFGGIAALFLGLNAYFIGIVQILVYAGAIMVLFLFIIMLLDLPTEERKKFPLASLAAGVIGGGGFLALVMSVLRADPMFGQEFPPLQETGVSDVHAIGEVMFTQYQFHLQVIGVLLLVAAVGVVVLSKRDLT